MIGKEAASERYNCFLAQMKLICDKAPDSGIPEESLLLVFTKSSWLTNRPSFEKIKRSISDTFEFQGGLLFNSKEFFQVKAKFPIAFTIWKYKNSKSNKKNQDKLILLQDLTWIDNKLLKNLPWPNNGTNNNLELDNLCNEIINDRRSIYVSLNSTHQLSIRAWNEQKMFDFKRDRRKSEIGKENVGGLPRNDHRMKNKKAYGEPNGLFIGFMDNLTPCRIKKCKTNVPWFRLDSAFMDCRKIRCVSGPTPVKSYCAFDLDSAKKTFFWFAVGRTISQTGFPMWVDAIELWAPTVTEKNEALLNKYIFSIGLADNECVETFFPFNNPIEDAPLIHVNNPMAPNNPDSFWSTTIAPSLKPESKTAPDLLIESVYKLYAEWSNQFRLNPEVYLSIDKPYFIGGGTLKKTAGLIQIKDFAESENNIELLALIQNIKNKLKIVKNEFYKFLLATDGLNYFNGQQTQLIKNDSISQIPPYNDNQFRPKSEFEKTIEKRLSLMAIILDTLKNDKNLGRTKLAKILYITDVNQNLNLNAKYYREAAGPLDNRFLYNEKIGLEYLGVKYGYFKVSNKTSSKINYLTDINFPLILNRATEIYNDKLNEIKKLITHFKYLDTQQSEILVTLYACWNDLLIDGKQIDDDLIIQEFIENWHIKKRRFEKTRLINALNWMKKNNIIPKGNNKNTHTYLKNKKEEFF